MHIHPSHIISLPLIETYGNMPSGPMHNQGLEQYADLEQHHNTVQRTLDLIKEEMKIYPRLSWMDYIQPLELKCRVSEDGMSMILCTMAGREFSIVPSYETPYVSPCRSTTLSLSSSDNEVPHYSWSIMKVASLMKQWKLR